MDAFGVIFLLCVGTYIVVKIVRKHNKKDNLERANYLKSKYPNGFREKFSTYYISESSSYDELSRMASTSEHELQRIEERIKSEREKRLREEEEKRRKEEEARRAEQERQRKIKEEHERKERELNEKYLSLKHKYPHGIATFEKRYIGSRLKEDVISNEMTLDKYEKYFHECDFYQTWNEAHKKFTQQSRNLSEECFKTWGCYTYDVIEVGSDEVGTSQKFSFKIWEHFCESFCRNATLDYSTRKNVKLNYTQLNEFLGNKRYFNTPVYDKVLTFIKSLPDKVLVVFGNSNLSDGHTILNEFHFKYLRSLLSQEGYDYVDIDNMSGILGSKAQNIVIVELITSNDILKNNCKYLLDLAKERKPCITYVSLLKEYSSDEMTSIIKSDEKKLQQLKEEERREQEAKAEAERQRMEFVKKQKEILEMHKQSSMRLKSCVASWTTVPRSNIPYSYLLNYYPTTCDFEATSDEWDDRRLVWNFKNTPGKTSEMQHEMALDEIIPRISRKLRETFGADLKYLTLVCIPASSQLKTQLRYEEFSERICQDTGMSNAYAHIKISGERGAKHAGEDTTGNISYTLEKDYFSGRNILLFDDVVTKGDSMRSWKQKMELCGSSVIAAVSIGLTTHERPYKQYDVDDFDLPF